MHKVWNKDKNIFLTQDLKEAKSFSDKLLGLLKKSNPRCLMFKTRFGIHTLFLRDSIDVIVLDQNFQVVKVKTLKPNKIFFWNPKYNLVLELPVGTIKRTNTQLEDTLSLLS